MGDFNNWDPKANEATSIGNGIYELIDHLSKVKVAITVEDKKTGESKVLYRVPSHIHYAIPDPLSNSNRVLFI